MRAASLTPSRKVLLLAPSLSSVGGVQNYVRTLHAALQEVLGPGRVRIVTVPGEPGMRRNGSASLRNSVKFRFALSAFAQAISWFPDLIICAHVGAAPIAELIQTFTGKPYWLILYGIEVWGDLSLAKLNALQAADCLVTITRFTLEAAAERHSLHPPRVLILPPALAQIDFHSEPSSAPPDGSQPPVVLTVGRLSALERYKGHDVMLEAWPIVLRRVPAAEYWIIGGGDDLPRLELRARQLGLANSVRFLGSVSLQELGICYDRCCVFAMPARTQLDSRIPRGEGFGIVFLEAMARGKPVVGPRIGAPAEFIHSGDHGLLVDPADPAAVAEALIELLQDPARARRMGEAGKEWVTREFSFERFCERLRQALPG